MSQLSKEHPPSVQQITRNLLMAAFMLAFLPSVVSLIGLPAAYLGGETIDSWQIYVVAVSIPISVLSGISLTILDRKDEQDRLEEVLFGQELEAAKWRGVSDEIDQRRKG